MRIIAGTLKGRKILLPRGASLRPTADRVREAVFSALDSMTELDGARVLDLYAGSGAFGLEALSRGATSAVFVERNRSLVEQLKENIALFGLSGTEVLQGDVEKLLRDKSVQRRGVGGEFSSDLIFADPPYDEHPGAGLFDWLLSSSVPARSSILVVEAERKTSLPKTYADTTSGGTIELLKRKVYGGTAVHFFQLRTACLST